MQPAFQRLRRVRQLTWTDYVYPGAMHTRWLEQTSLYETHLRRHGLAPSVTIVPGHHHFSIIDDYLDPTTLLAKAVLNVA